MRLIMWQYVCMYVSSVSISGYPHVQTSLIYLLTAVVARSSSGDAATKIRFYGWRDLFKSRLSRISKYVREQRGIVINFSHKFPTNSTVMPGCLTLPYSRLYNGSMLLTGDIFVPEKNLILQISSRLVRREYLVWEWHLALAAWFRRPSAGTRLEREVSSSRGWPCLRTRPGERSRGTRWERWGSTARWGWRRRTDCRDACEWWTSHPGTAPRNTRTPSRVAPSIFRPLSTPTAGRHTPANFKIVLAIMLFTSYGRSSRLNVHPLFRPTQCWYLILLRFLMFLISSAHHHCALVCSLHLLFISFWAHSMGP